MTFTRILTDGFFRNWRAEFERGAKGQFPRLVKIERQVIAFRNSDKKKILVWSLYRECCDGKFHSTLRDAIRVASLEISAA